MNISTDFGTWIMAFVMLSLFSFLWKENPCSRIAESLYVGAGSGYMLAMAYKNVQDMAFYRLSEGKLSMIVPIILGLCLFAGLTKKYSFLTRYGTALPLGMGAGLALRALPSAQILSQIRATLNPLNSINNIVILVGVVTTISYFLFTLFVDSDNKIVRTSSDIGRYYMMITFGLTFATAVFQHVAIYFGSLQLLLGDWLGLM